MAVADAPLAAAAERSKKASRTTRPATDVSAFRQLLRLLGDRRLTVGILVFTAVLAGLAESAILTITAQTAAALVDGARVVSADVGSLHLKVSVGKLLLIGFGLATVRLALQGPLSVLPAKIAADVQQRFRDRLFDAFTRASWDVQSRDREGHLQELMTNQVANASQGALSAASLVGSGVALLVLLCAAFLLNVLAAVAVSTSAIALFVVLRPLNRLGARRSRELSQAQMTFANGVGEAARLAEETQVFGVAAAQRRRTDRLVVATRDLFYRTQMLGRLTPNLYQSAIYFLVVLGLTVLHATGSGHVASLGAVVLLLVRAGSYGQLAQGSYQFVRQSLPYVDRLNGAIGRYLDSARRTGPHRLATVRTIEFRDVAFRYDPDRPVLSDLRFVVAAGETIGIVGPSGAGKSTLVQLLLNLREPTAGTYLVNNVTAGSYVAQDWHATFAYVPQDPRLLHASVADNIRYFRDIDDASVERAAREALIHDDIVSWPHGYDAVIGPRADAVSGGQQQRICIARALAGRPSVLILDEPTSALDPQSEAYLQQSLSTLAGHTTLFVVAHRMSTLEICDRVMVIVGGRLEAFATQAALKRDSEYFRVASAHATRS